MDDNTTTEVTVEEPTTGAVVIELEGLIKGHLTSIEKLESEVSKHKDMLEDFFNNDSTYKQHAAAAKEANRIKSNTKQQIMKQPQVADLATKVKDMKQELKEIQDALSDYLREYQRISGLSEIEGEDGELREIIYIARLVRKSFKR